MKRFKNILVVAPERGDTAPLLMRAASLARTNGAELTLLGVVDAGRTDRRVVLHDGREVDVRSFLVDTRREELQGIAAGVTDVDVRVAVTTGTGFVEVIRSVVELGHDLVFVSADAPSRPSGFTSSSMAMHLMRKSPVPVWLDTGEKELGRDVAIAVGPFFGSERLDALNTTILELGSSLASRLGGVLHVIHAWRLEGESMLRRSRHRPPADRVDAMVMEAYDESSVAIKALLDAVPVDGVPIELHVEKGEPGAVIPQVLDETRPGVVVMGTLARAGLRGVFMGNTAERVLGSIETSVLAVKPEGFETPVSV